MDQPSRWIPSIREWKQPRRTCWDEWWSAAMVVLIYSRGKSGISRSYVCIIATMSRKWVLFVHTNFDLFPCPAGPPQVGSDRFAQLGNRSMPGSNVRFLLRYLELRCPFWSVDTGPKGQKPLRCRFVHLRCGTAMSMLLCKCHIYVCVPISLHDMRYSHEYVHTYDIHLPYIAYAYVCRLVLLQTSWEMWRTRPSKKQNARRRR
jgi:hypothetical protein